MTIRFVAISTGNTRPLLEVLGERCDGIVPSSRQGDPDIDLSPDLVREIDAIAERNVTRRRIRYPRLFASRLVARTYRALYRRGVRRTFCRLYGALATDTSRTVLVFNGYLSPNALLALAAEALSMPRLFLENGFYPNTMQADPRGINALSTLPREAAFYDGLSEEALGNGWPETFEIRASKLPDGSQPASPTDLPAAYVFVPLQVPSDMQILALSPWIGDMVQMHTEIAALADAFSDRHFVIKEHPSFPLSIQPRVPAHPRIHFANGAATRNLLEGADAVITVNSTVGLEALTLGKKLIILGEAHYDIDGLVLRAHDRASLTEAFSRISTWEPDDARRRRFIRFVFNRFLVPLSRTNPGATALRVLEDRALGRDAYSRALERR
ncbi:MAG: nitrogen fixation protein FixF [Oricola sp.]